MRDVGLDMTIYSEYISTTDIVNGDKQMARPTIDRNGQRQVHIWLTEEIHRKLRLKVADLDITIQDGVVEAISMYVKTKAPKNRGTK